WSARRTLLAVGFALEDVVEIRGLTLEQRDQRRDPVGGEEEEPPALALSDMNPFVLPGGFEGLAVTSEHDMAERHRRGAAAEEGAASKKEMDESAENFQYAVYNLDTAAADKRGGDEEKTDERCGEGPEVHKESAHETIVVARRLG